MISSLKKINSINLRTFSTVHTNSRVGVDKYTRLPHEVFLLIRWIFTKGNKVLREDHGPSIKFNNFLPAKHVFKMLSYRNIGYASAGGYEDEARHSFSSQSLSFDAKVRFLTKKEEACSLDVVTFFHCSERTFILIKYRFLTEIHITAVLTQRCLTSGRLPLRAFAEFVKIMWQRKVNI